MGRKQNIPKPDQSALQATQTKGGAPDKAANKQAQAVTDDASARPMSGKGASKNKNKGANKKANRR